MQNFTFHNPTKIIFGQGTISQLGGEVNKHGKRALFIYGKNSIKNNGVYDQVVESLKAAGVEFVEFPGVKANPTLSHTREGIALVKKENLDIIVAVGGGSVIDEAKAIAAGVAGTVDVWDYYTRKAPVEKAIPIVTVLTMAATGSEMNGGTVITNEETKEKLGLGADAMFPRASILDPSTTFTVPVDQTAYGCVDAVTHLVESYFTCSDRFTPIQDRYVEGIVHTIVEIAPKIIANPTDYQLRATFMWAATLAWNNIAPSGVGDWALPNHMIGHSMSALFDTPHGASLSITLSGWLPWYAETRAERISQLGKAVFDVSETDPKTAANKTIELLRNWFRSIKSPTNLADIGVDEAGKKAVAANVEQCSTYWGLPQYKKELVLDILNRCE
ncbi:MAG: iron-containing alcohol dehydrogenase [Thermoguttaceae bacterium]